MKRFLSLLSVLVIIITMSFVVSASSPSNMPELYQFADDYFTTRDDFNFGFNVHFPGHNCYPAEKLEEQIHLVAKSGCKIIRINDGVPSDGDWTYLDTFVGICNKYGLDIILVNNPDRALGLDYITLYYETLARRYNGEDGRGFIKYYQCWNESEVALMKAKLGDGGSHGRGYNDYFTIDVPGAPDLPEYTECFRAAKQGIRNGNSKSKFMINFIYTHIGPIKWYIEHGVAPDVIGWDWYSHFDNYDESEAAFIENVNYIYNDIVKNTGIPVIICETNTYMPPIQLDYDMLSDNTTLEDYAQFVGHMKLAYETDWIKGLVVYELLDESNLTKGNEMKFGFVKCLTGGIIGSPKPIYYEYQRLIGGKKTNDIRMIDRSEIDLTPYNKLLVGTTDDSAIKDENEKDDEILPIPDIQIPDTEIPDTEIPDTSTIITDENKDSNDDNLILENKPETIVKKQQVTQKTYRIPWVLLIISSVIIIFVAGGSAATYIFISKRKKR